MTFDIGSDFNVSTTVFFVSFSIGTSTLFKVIQYKYNLYWNPVTGCMKKALDIFPHKIWTKKSIKTHLLQASVQSLPETLYSFLGQIAVIFLLLHLFDLLCEAILVR